LAAGKGVVVAETETQANDFLAQIFERRIFGPPSKVILEECLVGQELSYLVVVSGNSFVPLEPARDFKRIADGDQGPNTGGMGSCSSPALLSRETRAMIEQAVVIPTIRGLVDDGIDFRGVLYCGLMLTNQGPCVLEYNVRFGDPETQAILPRMTGDLLELLQAAAEGDLDRVIPRWSSNCSVCVVLASAGYPGEYRTGLPISGIDRIQDALVFHAGTRMVNGTLVTSGGRVLNVVGMGRDVISARMKAYTAADTISFEGKYFRRDIGI